MRVRALFLDDMAEKWRLNGVAARLAVSPRTLQRILRKEGFTFSEVLAASRLERAKDLLMQTDYSLTEIGFSLGYADSAHFSREFKARAGATPSQYRQRLGPAPP